MMSIVLARMVWNFDMEVMRGSIGWNLQKTWIVYETVPLMAQLTPARRMGVSSVGQVA